VEVQTLAAEMAVRKWAYRIHLPRLPPLALVALVLVGELPMSLAHRQAPLVVP
jgi:hypothetical protein